MANIDDLGFLADGFDQDQDDMDMEEEEPVQRRRIVDVQTSESEQEDLGEEIREDSSLLDSSSDSPVEHEVPSVSPGRKYTVGSVPKPPGQVPTDSHIPSSVSSMHVNVGTVSTAIVRTISEEALPSLLCSAHPTSWQPGCAVCDQALVLSSKAPVYDPKMAVADRLLGRRATPPTHAVELGVVWLEVAQHVCHQQEPMTAKQASSLMATSLKLPAAQELELNSNLRAEAFFQDFEKQRAFQPQFEYKRC